ncbi:MAG: AMP-binding protein, partial [bacterium]|nr:AMP-binding protein [bacterium]
LAEPLAVPAVESKFDLTLYVSEIEGTIELNLVYGRDLFDRVRMVEMLAQYAAGLARIAEHPEAAIGSFSLVTVEAEKLLPEPAAPLSERWEGSLHEGFSRQAERHPDHPAVRDPDEEWSYGELDRRSNQLARYLVAGGVEPGSVVAVWAHRNASLVWALLGILKAGAAFMIRDPAYPAARLGAYLRLGRPRGWLEVAGA